MLTWLGIPGTVAHKKYAQQSQHYLQLLNYQQHIPYFLIVIEFPPQSAYKGQEEGVSAKE